ncbi:recombinase family protein [Siphonobacter sp. SORGH_AS_0500]|uniref:recombinase family protein n=1 Tax=Siphonobacter sp. SORGH_AS_0500 TaxID=1864824 RepID=UPI00285E6E66|nr:recombinase family protein [Siphonobacter sp. SORGH_AS_0500]MDR6197347.1 DNA invertase Pin-like site-specific DNA recombinase [Siphonobacter sp. SORGH_AS_0500]
MREAFVAYYRVSTQKQGRSGLGLEAQKQAVENFVTSRGEVLTSFTDIESGKKNERPQLQAAIAHCKSNGATLLIAKLDRLTRNVAFVFTLRDSGVNFVCCDMPEANTLTIGILATMAQHERELIADRTKKALAEKKKRGFTLGTPANLTEQAKRKGTLHTQLNAQADQNNRRAGAFAKKLRDFGYSWAEIARQLNANGFTTRKGGSFQIVQVQRVVKLFK